MNEKEMSVFTRKVDIDNSFYIQTDFEKGPSQLWLEKLNHPRFSQFMGMCFPIKVLCTCNVHLLLRFCLNAPYFSRFITA